MESWEFRDGDIVEVFPEKNYGQIVPPFKGVVDTKNLHPGKTADILRWVYVRQLEPTIRNWAGGWYAHQCRLIIRPPETPALPLPDNVVVGEN